MIKLLRIDDRLIHGQVAVYWVNATGADTIVIANDKHATNAMLKMSLTVGKPAGLQNGGADRGQSGGLSQQRRQCQA